MTGITSAPPLSHNPPEPVIARPATPPADRNGWVLGVLLLLGAVLRLSGITRFPFEQDELYTIIEARWLYDSPLHPGIHARPLYYLLQHVLLEILPVSHASLRLMPVVFGMLGIWITWLLARRVLGTAAAITAALLVAISPWHLHASGMARYWSLVYLLAALFLLFLFEAGRHGRTRDYAGALAALLLGAAAHPTFVFPIAAIAVGFHMVRNDGRLRFPWPDARMLKRLWIPAAVLFAAAYLLLTSTQGGAAVRNWDGRGLLASLRLVPAMVEWATPVVLAAGAFGALLLCRSGVSPERRRWGLASALGVIAGTAALTGASFMTDVYADYGIAMLPLVFVSAGALVQAAADRMRAGAVATAAVCGTLLAAGVAPGTASYLSDGTRFDYRPAFREIDAAAPDRAVLSAPIAIQRHYAPHLRGIEIPFDRSLLEEVLGRESDVWVVVPVRRYGIWQDGGGDLAGWLVDRCRLHSSHQRPRFDYRLYRTDLYRCAAPTI